MSQNDDTNFLQLMKGDNDPELEKQFIYNLGDTVSGILTRYALLHNRIGLGGWDYFVTEDGCYRIILKLTDALVYLLPCVPGEIADKYAESYQQRLSDTIDQHGKVIEQWPSGTMDKLGAENYLILSVIPNRIRKFKATFSLAVSLIIPEKTYLIRGFLERALGLEKAPLLLSTSSREEPLWDYMLEYFSNWIISPSCWKTARERRIELYSAVFERFITGETNSWAQTHLEIPYKCLISAFWSGDTEFLSDLEPSQLREECLKIAGDVYNPGKDALFIVIFDLEEHDEGMPVRGYGPFAWDPRKMLDATKAIKLIQDAIPIFEKFVPEDDFASHVENKPCAEYENICVLDASAQKFACEFLNVLGVKEPEEAEVGT